MFATSGVWFKLWPGQTCTQSSTHAILTRLFYKLWSRTQFSNSVCMSQNAHCPSCKAVVWALTPWQLQTPGFQTCPLSWCKYQKGLSTSWHGLMIPSHYFSSGTQTLKMCTFFNNLWVVGYTLLAWVRTVKFQVTISLDTFIKPTVPCASVRLGEY